MGTRLWDNYKSKVAILYCEQFIFNFFFNNNAICREEKILKLTILFRM